jgi:predicted transcriptional regulator
VARHVRLLLERSGLGEQEFASRIGLPTATFAAYLDGSQCPTASLMIRMRRLSDRFAKIHDERTRR